MWCECGNGFAGSNLYVAIILHTKSIKHFEILLLSKKVLEQAKSFLCWDKYKDLTIKLIEIDTTVAFFYPPKNDLSAIVVFYEKNCIDFSNAIFLLFHEIGHLIQYKAYQTNNSIKKYYSVINADKGINKTEFERAAWKQGENILIQFLDQIKLTNSTLLVQYREFAEKCLLSYNGNWLFSELFI